MNLLAPLSPAFTALDTFALALLILCWLGTGFLAEHPPGWRPSVSHLMKDYRRRGMVEFLTRDPRIFDISLIDSLRQGTAFFVSGSMIAIGGGVAMIGNAATLQGLARDLTIGLDPSQIRVKLIVVVGLMANSLLKFMWSHRLFGYCAIMMASVPNDHTHPEALPRALQTAEVNIAAARGFNRGLNGVYFALAALAWLLGPEALIAATLFTTGVMLRREFASHSRQVMLETL
ncbi:DUF599 domain-containing protein [Rhodobacter sp. KR11]|uniref:DUF599 domain-containing protein n=1 Tax=Rhodobacter sp. KR11 TaxID=2974588 RepID=UPI002223A15E|nr:DUF599 domain-containing protein [Rhodobacter sp. KR11]MCW1918327.1 DUF599 domain-containing protein [Rhodobacter sp. KR11]